MFQRSQNILSATKDTFFTKLFSDRYKTIRLNTFMPMQIWVFTLLQCWMASVGSWLPTFQDSIRPIFMGQAFQEQEDRTNMLPRNIGNQQPTYTTQNPRRVKPSSTPQQKPEISHCRITLIKPKFHTQLCFHTFIWQELHHLYDHSTVLPASLSMLWRLVYVAGAKIQLYYQENLHSTECLCLLGALEGLVSQIQSTLQNTAGSGEFSSI